MILLRRLRRALDEVRYFFRRGIPFWWQRRTRGWSDDELWNLDTTLAQHALPRLRRFREITHGHPCFEEIQSMEDWHAALDKMILAMEWIASDRTSLDEPEAEVNEGLRLFGKYFRGLWD